MVCSMPSLDAQKPTFMKVATFMICPVLADFQALTSWMHSLHVKDLSYGLGSSLVIMLCLVDKIWHFQSLKSLTFANF